MARHFESQLDFIFFFYGLSFILLGALCLVLARGREDDRGTTIRLIGLFGCVHGANEWLDMLALIAGDSTEFLVVRAAVLTASFILLAEAGRNGGITRDLAMPGPWIYIPILVAIGAIGFVDGIESAKAATRYLLAAPGAILVAFTVFTGRHHDLHMNRSLMAGVAIAFALYAVAAGMIVETAPFWPARTFNQEMFQRVTGVPIQLVRGLIAVALAALIWAAWGRRVMETLDYPGYSLHLKRQFVGVLTTLLLVLALGWALTDYLGEIHRDDVESEAAGDVALLVSGLERETTIADAMVVSRSRPP
ncbi:sensor domain-containing diguanylate cyclase, partial [Rhodopseudomonas sp. BR0C11]|nr:sensor domain-containing diguanylate cyclase [Rhodopseudomonas sp. BR0C11]